MKELPYYRFTVAQWLQGDISLESYEHKGLFIDVCAYYWFKDCEVTYQMLSKRFANATSLLDELIQLKIIKKSASDLLEIKFLDEQYEKLNGISKKRAKSGKLGGLAKVANAKQKLSKSKANAKQMPIYKDKDKDKDKELVSRSQVFKIQVQSFKPEYPSDMLRAFYNYWTEPNKAKTKMRYELEKTWDLSLRLKNWASREKGFNKEVSSPKYLTPQELGLI